MPLHRVAKEPRCVGCGACCRGWLVQVDDPGQYVTPLKLTQVRPDGERYMSMDEATGACVALDTDRNVCTIYENRPQVCRDFERLSRECWNKLHAYDLIGEFTEEVAR